MAKSRIFVLEDDRGTQLILRAALEGAGYEVRCIDTAGAALTALRDFKPDLALLDVDLPDGSGFNVCASLRLEAAFAQLPVIFLTVRHDLESRLMGFAYGARDFVPKPFAPEELLARVRVHLQTVARSAETPAAAASQLPAQPAPAPVAPPNASQAGAAEDFFVSLLMALQPLLPMLSEGREAAPGESLEALRGLSRELPGRLREGPSELLALVCRRSEPDLLWARRANIGVLAARIALQMGLGDGEVEALALACWTRPALERASGTAKTGTLHERIAAVAEHYESLSHDRPGRRGLTPHDAVARIVEEGRSRFDDAVVKSLIKALSLYPPGTYVVLNNGTTAKVLVSGEGRPTRPIVLPVLDARGRGAAQAQPLDLLAAPMVRISRAVHEADLRPADVLDARRLRAERIWKLPP